MPPLDPQFDAFADDYDAALEKGLGVSGESKDYFARGRLMHLARVLSGRGVAPQAIMDYGCGTGSSTPFLRECFPSASLVGTDISAKSLETARNLHGGERTRFVLMNEYIPDQSLDLVFSNGVFHHIPPAERPRCLRYILDCLKPGGHFALFENNPWNPGTRLVMRRIPFDRDAVTISPPAARRMLAVAGFAVVRTDSLFYFPRMFKWLRPVESLLRRVPLGAQYVLLAQKP
jgi:trans-aconitate methyltransferase